MTQTTGKLRYRVGFYQRGGPSSASPPPPDYGYPGGDFGATPVMIEWANIEPRLGGEAMQAARLSGKNFVNITVRQSDQTSMVDTEWKAKNEDSGEEYNIRSVIDPNEGNFKHGFYFEMLCEKGVAI